MYVGEESKYLESVSAREALRYAGMWFKLNVNLRKLFGNSRIRAIDVAAPRHKRVGIPRSTHGQPEYLESLSARGAFRHVGTWSNFQFCIFRNGNFKFDNNTH